MEYWSDGLCMDRKSPNSKYEIRREASRRDKQIQNTNFLMFKTMLNKAEIGVFDHLNFENLKIVSACPGATCLDDSAAHVSQVWARDFDLPAIARDGGT